MKGYSQILGRAGKPALRCLMIILSLSRNFLCKPGETKTLSKSILREYHSVDSVSRW
jgi:hypothetical protein